ncbi:hypothetical protein DFH27DRAFT_556774 [Peziza echinospora]|nr:hypothetical protein DFH27DRAFT_556774 [Peziza echinospora]
MYNVHQHMYLRNFFPRISALGSFSFLEVSICLPFRPQPYVSFSHTSLLFNFVFSPRSSFFVVLSFLGATKISFKFFSTPPASLDPHVCQYKKKMKLKFPSKTSCLVLVVKYLLVGTLAYSRANNMYVL